MYSVFIIVDIIIALIGIAVFAFGFFVSGTWTYYRSLYVKNGLTILFMASFSLFFLSDFGRAVEPSFIFAIVSFVCAITMLAITAVLLYQETIKPYLHNANARRNRQ